MLLTLALLSALATAPAADSLSGTWKITGDVSGNAIDETCTITQTGATLAGSCVGNAGEKLELTGEVKDGKVTFTHGGTYDGQALTITFTSTASTAKELKGSVFVLPFNVTGTFSAAPTASPAPTPTPAKP
jgi:hypothetical protein